MMTFQYPGPDLDCSLHNHSDFSDGASPLEEVCRAGKASGCAVFGVSDHWVIPPGDGFDAAEWRMPPERLGEYVDRMLKLRRELEDGSFHLKIGLEVDFFFENADAVLAGLEGWPLDYLIGSVHYADRFPIDHCSDDWRPLSAADMERSCDIYWKKLLGAAACERFTFIGHLDLPKKYGFIDNRRYFPRAVGVLDELQKHGGALELNTAGWFKPCAEAYPAPELLREARRRELPVAVSSDSHRAADVRRDFARAAALLEEAGYPRRG